ncbi:hypothetical protein B0H19DRAFT_1233895 [Mycena capillaripes]|nr:hypothetical protein B0H19DRAFT_1233895 [Mycena capillaripes]
MQSLMLCTNCGASTTTPLAPSPLPLASDSSRLIFSNEVPLASEIPTIKQVLTAGRNRIESLRTEIAELRVAMERRIWELKQTEETVRKHTAVLSAVRRVPTEIICDILAWTLSFPQGNQQPKTPWQLGHICQSWRAAALGYPFLWSSITLNGTLDLPIDDLCSPLMLETQIRRAGNAPLAIDFDFRSNGIVDLESSESIRLILRHSTRWGAACLRLHYSVARQTLNRLQMVKGQLPRLRTLELWSPFNPNMEVGDIFLIAPSLREVFLTDESYAILSPSHIQLPWSQITRFRACHTPASSLNFLEAAPNVAQYGLVTHVENYHGAPHVVLAHLRRLDINAGPAFLNFVTAPVLQELWIAGRSVPSLLDCIQRSSCHLVKLVINECETIIAVIPILRAIPTLTTFFVLFEGGSTNANHLFDALTITGGLSDICPNLARIAAGEIPSSALDSFIGMVQSRWYTNGSRLSFVRAFYLSYLGRDAIPSLDRMKEEGLDVGIDIGFRPSQQNYIGFGRP